MIEGISKQRGSAFATASTSPRRSAQPTHLRLRGKLTIYRASHEQALKPGLVPAAVLASGSLKRSGLDGFLADTDRLCWAIPALLHGGAPMVLARILAAR